MSEKKVLKVRTQSKPSKTKVSNVDPSINVKNDRVTVNMSFEVFNGCWVGSAYESDVGEGESLEECKERVYEFVEKTVTEKAEMLSQLDERESE